MQKDNAKLKQSNKFCKQSDIKANAIDSESLAEKEKCGEIKDCFGQYFKKRIAACGSGIEDMKLWYCWRVDDY